LQDLNIVTIWILYKDVFRSSFRAATAIIPPHTLHLLNDSIEVSRKEGKVPKLALRVLPATIFGQQQVQETLKLLSSS